MEGSADQISLNSEAIYSGYQSVNYAKKSMSSLFSLLSANNVDYSLISNLGFDYQSIINNLNEQYNKLTDYSSRLLKVKNILLEADPNNEYLFQQIDLQFIGMDMGDNPSETDLIAYFNTMKKVYYTAKGKDVNELSDFEKAIIKNYEESGYADFDEYQELISEISQLKAEYSELNKQNQMGAGLGGYSVSTDSEKYNENQNRLIELTKKLDELESRSSFLEKNLKEKGLIELSGWEELKVAGSKYIDTIKDFKNNIVNGEFEEAYDNIKTLKATNAVVLGKVTSGILKIGELLQDGTIMLETTGASIITLGIDAVFGTNYTDSMWESTMDYVAIDQVGNIEKVFYENTSLGKELNDESILKYNSKGAESIKNASKKVGEIAAATAITVATGGAAAPLVAAGIGFLEGTGQGGEKYFSMTDENGNYTNRSVKDIGLSYLEGIQKGAEWYISGQVGSGFYNGVKSFVNPASITREVASRATGNTFKDAVVNTIKSPDMYVDFAAATAKAGAGYITNGKVNWKDYAFEMGFSVLGNFAGELLGAAAANKTFVKNIDEQITRANIASKETGTVSQIKIHSIEDLTDKQLEAISDKQLVCFVVDSKKQPVSFEDAFIELKRSGKIPADSPLMKEYQNEITRQIQYANYRAGSHDNFMSVRVDSLDDLTDGQLRMIGNRDLVSFQVASKNGEIVSFEDAFIELKRRGKIPDDSPLMKEYKSKIATEIMQAQEAIGKNITPKVIKIDSINDLTLEQVLEMNFGEAMCFQVKEFDNKWFTYEQIYNSLKSKGSMLADVTRTAKGQTDVISKARSVYYELGKKVHYNVEAMDDNLIKDEMLSKMTTFDKLNSDNKIVCRGWSELYKEALIESGVSVDDIRIINAGGQHWWVEAYDPKYNCFIVADATEATRTNGLMNFDLSSVKNGMPTKGFYVLSAEDYYSIKRKNGVFGTRIGNLAKDLKLVSNNDAYLRKLDISLGYASKQGYKAELVEKANKFFSDNLLLDKVFSSEPNAVKRNIFLKVPLDENVDGYESYGYFKKIFGDEAKLSWQYSKKYDTILSIRFPNDPTVMVYSKKLGRRIMSEAEYLELVSQI